LDIVEEERTVEYADEQELLEDLWGQLQQPDHEEYKAVWDQYALNSIELEGGQVTLDISAESDVQMGASGEGIAIQTLLDTYQQVEGVETVQILIDGGVQESLGGHILINEPLSVDEDFYSGE
jgi:spore germination protein GerM